jgi:hyperosmotically inducible protein
MSAVPQRCRGAAARRNAVQDGTSPTTTIREEHPMKKKNPPVRRTVLAAVAALALAGCATTGQYVDDSWLTSKSKTALIGEGLGEVTVETTNGVVQLAGFVKSQADMDKAVATVRKLEGVKSVSNRMELRPAK